VPEYLVVLELSKSSRILALSLVALMLFAGAVARPVSALNPINPPPTFTLTGSPAVSGPTYAIVYNGNLWVSDFGANKVNEYAAPYTANEAPTLTFPVTSPAQLAFDSAGNLWVGSFYAGDVYEFDSPITNGESPSVTLSGMNQPQGVTINDGNLWVFSEGSGSVYEFSPAPTANMASPPTPILSLAGATEGVFDSSNDLWVSSYSGSSITEYASPVHSGEASSSTLHMANSGYAETIAFDGAGNLWAADPNPGTVDEFTAPLTNGETGTSMITNTASDSFWGISVDPSGNIWIGDYADNAVYEWSGLASSFSAPFPTHFPALPAVIPTTFTFNFKNSSSIVGKEVGLWGSGVIYNLPGYNPKVDFYPYAVNICSNAGNSTESIYGYFQTGQGHNATELYVYNWSSINTPSAGWPSETACKA